MTTYGVDRRELDPRGRRLSLYPDDPDCLADALRECGLPLGGEVLGHWQLRVQLPAHGMDETFLIAKDGWSGQRYGRWRVIAW